jgi:hypothetical protein
MSQKKMKDKIKISLSILLLFAMTGCIEETAVQIQAREQFEIRKASLKDGRVHVGMTERQFLKIWDKPDSESIDRSTSTYGVTEWWRYDRYCHPVDSWIGTSAHYRFCFENGILDYWSEN